MKLYVGAGGWGINTLSPNEKGTNEELIIGIGAT